MCVWDGDSLIVRVHCHNGNRAQLECAGPPCSQAAPRATEQNNTKLVMYTLQDMTILQCVCVRDCLCARVCVVQLCVFPGPYVVSFISRLTFCFLTCADCVNLKNGSACCYWGQEELQMVFILDYNYFIMRGHVNKLCSRCFLRYEVHLRKITTTYWFLSYLLLSWWIIWFLNVKKNCKKKKSFVQLRVQLTNT